MTKPSGLRLTLLLGLLVLAREAAARTVLPGPGLDPASGLGIELSTAFQEPPLSGALPLQIQVRNDTPRDAAFELLFTSGRAGIGASLDYRVSVFAEAHGTRIYETVVPLVSGRYYGSQSNQVTLLARGPATTGAPVTVLTRYFSGNNPTQFVGLSESLAARGWEPVKTALEQGRGRALFGTRFDASLLPSDWRAYSGFGAIALTDPEWQSLGPGPRKALKEWIGFGGRLVLTGETPAEERLGAGSIVTLRFSGADDADALARAFLEGVREVDASGGYAREPIVKEVGTVAVRSGPLALFMVGFALLVGPVNLFWLCRGTRRYRLFWTTPAFSVAATTLLAALIFVQDGIGGSGRRFTAILLLPDDHAALVLQEQVARTGVLLSGRFESREPLQIDPLSVQETSPRGSGGRYDRAGDGYDGFFASRSVQGQLLRTVRPTRARLELVRGSEAPQVVSSFEGTLDALFVVDAAGDYWKARSVGQGRKLALAPSSRAELDAWAVATLRLAGPAGRAFLQPLLHRPGHFYAAATAQGAPVPTLGSIGWTQQGLVVAGKLS